MKKLLNILLIIALLVIIMAGLAIGRAIVLGDRTPAQDDNNCTNECNCNDCDYKDEYPKDLQFNIYYTGLYGVANSDYNPLTFTAATPTFYIHAPKSRRQGHYIFAYWEWYVLDCVCVVHICDEYCDDNNCEIYYDYECYCYGLRRERVDVIPQGTVGHLRLYARWIRHTLYIGL